MNKIFWLFNFIISKLFDDEYFNIVVVAIDIPSLMRDQKFAKDA